MQRFVQGLLLAGTLIAGFNLPAALAASGPATHDTGMDLRNARYCEILLVTGTMTAPTATVYSTIGLNQCPEAQWTALDSSALRQEHHALGIEMNGPRYFMVDRISTAHIGPVVSFDGLQMRQLATIAVASGGLHSTPYAQRTILRTTTYVYTHGKPIYELLSPDGHTYVLQSYALIVDPGLTQAALPALAGRLTLPQGWHYRMVVPAQDLVLKVKGKATVLQDSLDDTYQLVQ